MTAPDGSHAPPPTRRSKPKRVATTFGRFTYHNAASLETVQPPSWLIGGVLRADTYAMLYGAPNSFKSMLALGLAVAIGAEQDNYLSFPLNIEQGAALYIGGEDTADTAKRFRAWQRKLGHAAGFHLSEQVPQPGEIAEFIEIVKAATGRERFDLIVLDVVANGMVGMNEDSAGHVSTFNTGMLALREALGGTVLALHHSGKRKNRGARGSSAFDGKVRQMLHIDRRGDAATVSIKGNAGTVVPSFTVALDKTPSDGSATLKRVADSERPAPKPKTVTTNKRHARNAGEHDQAIADALDKIASTAEGYSQRAVAGMIAEASGISESVLSKRMLKSLRYDPTSKTSSYCTGGKWCVT